MSRPKLWDNKFYNEIGNAMCSKEVFKKIIAEHGTFEYLEEVLGMDYEIIANAFYKDIKVNHTTLIKPMTWFYVYMNVEYANEYYLFALVEELENQEIVLDFEYEE